MQKTTFHFLDFFKNKRVFITGHTGFKGSWLCFLLSQLGAEVKGYSLEPEYENNTFNHLSLQNLIDHKIGDIRNFDLLSKELNSFEPEIVFHLAAQPLVRRSFSDPRETFETNIMGSSNLLDILRKTDFVRSLVFVTSDKCYENMEWSRGYVEDDRLGGIDPYSSSKAGAEIIFSSFQRSFFKFKKNFGAASARAGNVIGGGDWSVDRIIPDCVRSIIKEEPVFLRNPDATRPWQHVFEPIHGYLLLAYRLFNNPNEFSGNWNFGPPLNERTTVAELTQNFFDIIGKGGIEIDDSYDKNQHESQELQLDCSKATNKLMWETQWNVKKTVQATAEWYSDFIYNKDLNDTSKKQLNDFFNLNL